MQVFRKLQTVFRSIGASLCTDLSLFTHLSLELAYREFKRTYTTFKTGDKFHAKVSGLPVIASECPGWVCYAEKRVGELALPHMSTTKSPQQLFGVLTRLWHLKIIQDVSGLKFSAYRHQRA